MTLWYCSNCGTPRQEWLLQPSMDPRWKLGLCNCSKQLVPYVPKKPKPKA